MLVCVVQSDLHQRHTYILVSTKMASQNTDSKEKPKLVPHVAQYGPYREKGLKVGQHHLWCVCGLSKDQPWCDFSHCGTGFDSLEFEVTKKQTVHELCGCKHTKTPPYCDGSHTYLPEVVNERCANCPNKETAHKKEEKMCTGCGWVPDF